MGRALAKVAFGFGVVVMSMLVGLLALFIFASSPTGDYHVQDCTTHEGLVAHVYQDMYYAPDRKVFSGSPAAAWQLYFNLTMPPMELRTADLQSW